MREDVLIVLNERESLKRQMAELLENQLKAKRFSTSRLTASERLPQLIALRSPRVLVLDYLLGDEGSALDIIKDIVDGAETQVILWTDEPGISVAVSAIKLGAADFVELSGPKELEKVLNSIQNLLAEPQQQMNTAKPRSELKLIAQSVSARQTLAEASSAAKQNLNLIVLSGPRGSGRDTLARYIHEQRKQAGSFFALDLSEPDPAASGNRPARKLPEKLFGGPGFPDSGILSKQATVFVDHLGETEHCPLFKSYQQNSANLRKNPACLILGCTEISTALNWQAKLGARLIQLPSLAQRAEDIWPLLLYFQSQAQTLCKLNQFQNMDFWTRFVASDSWPANIKELRVVSIDALSTPLELLQTAENKTEANELLKQAMLLSKRRFEFELG